MAPEVCMMMTTFAMKFVFFAKRVKDPFLWFQLVDFALLYGIYNQGFCHLVVASMASVMFDGMCRYNDASRLRWRHVTIEPDGNSFHFSFEKRKNAP